MNNELENLKQQIEQAKNDYYQTGTSPLTDLEYDRLVEKAEKLGYIDTVGSKPVKNIPVIQHEHPMLSLDKVHSSEEVTEFVNGKDFVVMNKEDGLTISATYIGGILSRLETRGDGVEGNDIMFHANSIENLPKLINISRKYVIDGECVILYSDFDKINGSAKGEKYSNPRNLAAGSLNQLDPKISKTRHLRFYAWDVVEGGETDSLFDNLMYASNRGFDIVHCLKTNDADPEHLVDIFNDFRNDAKNDSQPIDGIVIKFDSISYGKTLGRTEHHFKNALAFKFESEIAETKLKEVTWQIGKTSSLCPVAIFNPPVSLSGSIVERASLHNVSIMKQLGLTDHCTCYVTKKNEIIPQIEYVDNDGDGEIEIPQICPVCGGKTEVIKQNDSEVLYCTNPNCSGKLLGKLSHFASKQGLDIDGLSEKTLEDLIGLNMVSSFEDIFNLANHAERLKKIPGYGKKSVDNLLAAIEKSRKCDLQHFISALSIPGIGVAQSKELCKVFPTWNDFYKAAINNYDFTKIDGIGNVLSQNIKRYFKDNNPRINDLASCINFTSAVSVQPSTNSSTIAGKTFCVTGDVHHFKNRKELSDKIECLGGKVSGSVSGKTDYLINNDINSSSSKNTKAKNLNIPIITEDDFLKMIGE